MTYRTALDALQFLRLMDNFFEPEELVIIMSLYSKVSDALYKDLHDFGSNAPRKDETHD